MNTNPLLELQQLVRLQQILTTMDIPKDRKEDIGWLRRDIEFRNGSHPDIEEAKWLLRTLRASSTIRGLTTV